MEPSRQRRNWTVIEDQMLREQVEAQVIESGDVKECAKRWQQSLDPDFDHSEWRVEEDRILIEATQQLGRHWKDIQREYFPGRPKNTIKNRYTVLVRRYQNQGITLPSRASSSSESNSTATLSNCTPDNEYTYDNPSIYNNLMRPHHQGTSADSHRSRSSLDSKAAISAWSNPHGHELPRALPHHPNVTHATNTILDYAYAPPRTHSITPHDWATQSSSSPMDAPMQARSPVSYSTSPTLPQQYYDDYTTAQPLMSPSGRPYSRSPARASYPGMLPNAVPTSSPRARAWSEQQGYASLPPTTYPDPRLQQSPVYRF